VYPSRLSLVDLRTGERCDAGLPEPRSAGTLLAGLLRPAETTGLHSLIQEIAGRHDVPPELLSAVLMAESRGNPFAIGDDGRSVGLFQLHENGLGAGLIEYRTDPATSASVAARSLAIGWREGRERGLAGDALVRFAYDYQFNPGAANEPQGDLIAALFRRFSGEPRALGDPPIDFEGVLQDAAEFLNGEQQYLVLLFLPAPGYAGMTSLSGISISGGLPDAPVTAQTASPVDWTPVAIGTAALAAALGALLLTLRRRPHSVDELGEAIARVASDPSAVGASVSTTRLPANLPDDIAPPPPLKRFAGE
jgi:hypothetical protein